MKEQLISFETAKLAKEKGFDIPVRYGVFGKKMKLTENHGWEYKKKLQLRNWNTSKAKSFSVPTQSLLQKWLREKKGIILSIEFNFSKLNYDVFYYKKENDEGKHIIEECATYEEALEFGLIEALKLIEL